VYKTYKLGNGIIILRDIQGAPKMGQVSLGSVATYARCGGIINNEYAVNLQRNLLVKKMDSLFWPTLYVCCLIYKKQ